MQISDKWDRLKNNSNVLSAHGRSAFSNFLHDEKAVSEFSKNLDKVLSSYGISAFMKDNGLEDTSIDSFVSTNIQFIDFTNSIEGCVNAYYVGDHISEINMICSVFYNMATSHISHTRHDSFNKIYCKMHRIVQLSAAKESNATDEEGMVRIIKNFKSRDKNGNLKATSLRFPRAVNTLFPGLPEAFVDALNDVWRDSFGKLDMSKFNLHCGRTARHFSHAYDNGNVGRTMNIETTVFTKSLSNSCMQYASDDDDGWEEGALGAGMHCAEAYATPEYLSGRYFEILYLTNKEDPFADDAEMYARSVFSRRLDGKIEWGPLYVCSNFHKSIMLEKMREMSIATDSEELLDKLIDRCDNQNYVSFPHYWHGAKLACYKSYSAEKLTVDSFIYGRDGRSVIAPYIDAGRKKGFSIAGEDGYMYIGVLGSEDDCMRDERFVDDGDGTLISNTHKASIFSMENHQGLNYLGYVSEIIVCHHCGELITSKYFEMRLKDLDGVFNNVHVCSACKNEYIVLFDENKELYCMLKSDVDTSKLAKFLNLPNPKGTLTANSQLNLSKINKNFSYALCHTQYERRERDVGNILITDEIQHLEDFEVGITSVVFEDVYFPKEMTVSIDDRNYSVFDNRIGYCFKTDSFVLGETVGLQVLAIYGDLLFTMKLNKESFSEIENLFIGLNKGRLHYSIEMKNFMSFIHRDSDIFSIISTKKHLNEVISYCSGCQVNPIMIVTNDNGIIPKGYAVYTYSNGEIQCFNSNRKVSTLSEAIDKGIEFKLVTSMPELRNTVLELKDVLPIIEFDALLPEGSFVYVKKEKNQLTLNRHYGSRADFISDSTVYVNLV